MASENESCCNGMFNAKTCIISIVIIGLALLGSAYILSLDAKEPINVYSSAQPDKSTISVSGSATVEVEPDLLVLQLSVETEDESAEVSQQENAQKTNALLTSLKSLGVKEEDIKSVYYNVYIEQESHYICSNDSEKSDCYWDYLPSGYKTTHSISVKIQDLDKGGEIIDAAVKSGATEVDSISFTLKPETRNALKKSLFREATTEARDKADEIAKGSKVILGKPTSISESYSYDPYPYLYKGYDMVAEAGSSAVDTSLSSGQITVSADVNAVFEIQ